MTSFSWATRVRQLLAAGVENFHPERRYLLPNVGQARLFSAKTMRGFCILLATLQSALQRVAFVEQLREHPTLPRPTAAFHRMMPILLLGDGSGLSWATHRRVEASGQTNDQHARIELSPYGSFSILDDLSAALASKSPVQRIRRSDS